MYYTHVANIGNHILVRGVDGKRVNQRVSYQPTLYVKTHDTAVTKWRSIDGQKLEPLKFASIYDAREFISKYKDVDNFKIYGQQQFPYAYIAEVFGGKVEFDPSEIVIGNIDIEVASDAGFPAPEHAFSEITAITLHVQNKFIKESANGFYYVFGCGEYINTRSDVRYYKCKDEHALIEKFLDVWECHYPDIVTGWSIEAFDIPYIINRMNRIFMEEHIKRLSPWGKIQERSTFQKGTGKEVETYEILGISIVDYLTLYRKHAKTPNQENYKLNHIAFVEIGETKIDYSEFDNLFTLYKRDYQKFIDYNIKDVTLVKLLNDKLRLLELVMTLAYNNKVNFNDVFAQVRMWDAITYNELLKKNMVVPPKATIKDKGEFVGAYVKEPKPGLYQWVVGFDLDGLYPHLKMMFNISPETIVDPHSLGDEFYQWHREQTIDIDSMLDQKIDTAMLKKYNVSMTPNGQIFKRDKQGFIPEILESMYKDRKKYKDLMIDAKKKLEAGGNKEDLEKEISMCDNFQGAMKINLNSEYGASGNQYYRFFDLRMAAAVTTSGQLAIRWIQRDMNDKLNQLAKTDNFDFIIASDTDSMYLNLKPIIEKHTAPWLSTIEVIRMMDVFCEKTLQPFIKKSFERLDEYVNSFASKMNMKREALCDVAIWTGKKHYMLNVWNNEGVEYKEPKLKIVGLEAVKAGSLSTAARDKIKKGYQLIIKNDLEGLRAFADICRDEFYKLPVEDIALPISCNELNKYRDDEKLWKSKTPYHIKGALIHNQLLEKNGLTQRYPEIKAGEKIKFVYLKDVNPIQQDGISFLNSLPKEFGLHEYIDYDIMFDRSFIDPITTILDAIGWELEPKNSILNFF